MYRMTSEDVTVSKPMKHFEMPSSAPGPAMTNSSSPKYFGEDEFVMAGPGALDGISKCFIGLDTVTSSDVIRYMFDHQEEHFERLDIGFPNLWGRRLQLIDCQNLFC